MKSIKMSKILIFLLNFECAVVVYNYNGHDYGLSIGPPGFFYFILLTSFASTAMYYTIEMMYYIIEMYYIIDVLHH